MYTYYNNNIDFYTNSNVMTFELRKLPGEVAKRLQILKTKSSGYFLNFYGMTMTWMTENLHQQDDPWFQNI